MYCTNRSYPKSAGTWIWAACLAIVGNVFPFALITWGTRYVSTGLIGILAAATVVPTMVLAHFLIPRERLSAKKMIAIVISLSGVLLVVGYDQLANFRLDGMSFWAQLVVLASTLGFALNNVLFRLVPKTDLISFAATVMLISGVVCISVVPLVFGVPDLRQLRFTSLICVGFLGIVTSAAATVAIYKMIDLAGVQFASYLNYLLPIYALALVLRFA